MYFEEGYRSGYWIKKETTSDSSSRNIERDAVWRIGWLDSGQTRSFRNYVTGVKYRQFSPPVEGGLSRIRGGRRRSERARQLTDVSRDVRRMWAERFIAP